MSEMFNQKYIEIISPINQELSELKGKISRYFPQTQKQKNEIIPIIKDFLSNNGKRIRPALIFLLVKALQLEITELHHKIALSNEFLHNATLIHDDIIDCSNLRRGEKTLNFNYDSKLAVLAGDYLLTEVLKILHEINNPHIQSIYIEAMSALIQGELFQYFNRFKILKIEDYIEKSKNKTAKLFEAGLLSVVIATQTPIETQKKIKNFAENFGTAFQIHNDLKNFEKENINEDIENGDYTAPIIFYLNAINNAKNNKTYNSLKKLKPNEKLIALNETRKLIQLYTDKAIENISFIGDNLYKQALINLCKLYAENWKEYRWIQI